MREGIDRQEQWLRQDVAARRERRTVLAFLTDSRITGLADEGK